MHRIRKLLRILVYVITTLLVVPHALADQQPIIGERALILPDTFLGVIKRDFPTLRIPTESDLTGNWKDLKLKKGNPPFIAWGDFNVDRLTDIGIILVSDTHWKWAIYHQQQDGTYVYAYPKFKGLLSTKDSAPQKHRISATRRPGQDGVRSEEFGLGENVLFWGHDSYEIVSGGSNEVACHEGNGQACVDLGLAAQRAKDYDKALPWHRLGCEREVMWGCTSRGWIYQQLGEPDKAQENFSHACSHGETGSCWQLGLIAKKDGKLEIARAYFEQDCKDGKYGYGCYEIGLLEKESGNIDAAREIWRRWCNTGRGDYWTCGDIYDEWCKEGDEDACRIRRGESVSNAGAVSAADTPREKEPRSAPPYHYAFFGVPLGMARVRISKNRFDPEKPQEWIASYHSIPYEGRKLETMIKKDLDGDGVDEVALVGEYWDCSLTQEGCPMYGSTRSKPRKRYVAAILKRVLRSHGKDRWYSWEIIAKRVARDFEVRVVFLEDIPNGVRMIAIENSYQCDDDRVSEVDIIWDKEKRQLVSNYPGDEYLLHLAGRDCGE